MGNELSEALKYQVPADVVTQSIANELILLNNKTEMYYSLDAVGAVIFEALAKGDDTDSVADLVCASFDGADLETVQGDMFELISNLEQRHLLEEIR